MSVIEKEIETLMSELDTRGINYQWVLDDYEGDLECQSHILGWMASND